jgi:7-cyano-7-deazaguanine synthase
VKTRYNTESLKGLSRERTNKVVLLASGGIDSMCAGLVLKKKRMTVYPLFFDYAQAPVETEWHCVVECSRKLGFEPAKRLTTTVFPDITHHLPFASKPLTDDQAYVPARNTYFMIVAGIYAYHLNADGISLGYMLEDNFVFGDNMYVHHLLVESLLSESLLRPMEVFLPIMSLTKSECIRMLLNEGVLESTVSCWNAKLIDNKVKECGRCANCKEKIASLRALRS